MKEQHRYALPLNAQDWDNLKRGDIIIIKGASITKIPNGGEITPEERDMVIEVSRPMHNSKRTSSITTLCKFPPEDDVKQKCPQCGGSGRIKGRFPVNYPPYILTEADCPTCAATGK